MRRLLRRTRGQALVETAIVLPLAVFMLLGIVQITLIQQARLMTENAAFSAARAGIVFNGNRVQMTNAAFLAVVPALPIINANKPLSTDTLINLVKQSLIQSVGTAIDMTIDQLQSWLGQIGINLGIPAFATVRVDVFNPTQQTFDQFVNAHQPAYSGSTEVDFDDTFNALNDSALRDVNRLSVRVRFLYPMRIPFANWIIFMAYMAGEAGVQLTGPIWRPMVPGETLSQNTRVNAEIAGRLPSDPMELLFGNRDQNLLGILWNVGTTYHNYLIPLRASYMMRMQSNVFRANLQSMP